MCAYYEISSVCRRPCIKATPEAASWMLRPQPRRAATKPTRPSPAPSSSTSFCLGSFYSKGVPTLPSQHCCSTVAVGVIGSTLRVLLAMMVMIHSLFVSALPTLLLLCCGDYLDDSGACRFGVSSHLWSGVVILDDGLQEVKCQHDQKW